MVYFCGLPQPASHRIHNPPLCSLAKLNLAAFARVVGGFVAAVSWQTQKARVSAAEVIG